jgi:hypothetical protein
MAKKTIKKLSKSLLVSPTVVYLHHNSKQMKTQNTAAKTLTIAQIKKTANAYLSSIEGLPVYVRVRVVRGTFHCDNFGSYFLVSLAQMLRDQTGLRFTHMTASMARLEK